jgi:hypothetical protein
LVRFRLPVSGLELRFRQPTGAEDLLLLEAEDLGVDLAITLLTALARTSESGEWSEPGEIDWHSLSVTDLDAALLALRRGLIGDRIQSTIRCPCGETIDIDFGAGDYLAQHAPRQTTAMRAVTVEADGWYRLTGADVRFRLPSCADQSAVQRRDDADKELARRCLKPDRVAGALRRRIESAMEALAPNLCGSLEGVCPGCQATVQIAFDPQRYVLEELKQRATFLLEEVHLIASRYRWQESDILALPQARRARYAELLFDARAGA